MKNHHNIGIIALAIIFTPACSAALDPDAAQDFDGEDVARAESTATECLYIDTQREYKSKFFGKKGDDVHPLNGKTVTRVEFKPSTSGTVGQGNATMTRQDSEAVAVHWWLDAFTHLSYTLRVWVKEC